MNNIHFSLVIPAAGLGTRMRSINSDIPKELLAVGQKPAIHYAIVEGLAAGITNIIIIINKQKDILRRYLEEKAYREKLYPQTTKEMEEIEQNCSITFLFQSEPLGEADAISLASGIVGNHNLAIIYPDNIYLPAPGALSALKAVFEQYRSDVVALTEVTNHHASGISNSGRVDLTPMEGKTYRIDKFHDKGSGHFMPRFKGELRASGIMVAGPHLFDYINRVRPRVKDGEFTDVPVRSLILKEKGLLGYHLPGRIFDIGNPTGYQLCLQYLA